MIGVAPKWLELELRKSDLSVEEIAALLDRAPLDLRVNRLMASREDVIAQYPTAAAIDFAPDALRLPADSNVVATDGHFEIQDAGSQLAAGAVHAAPGMTFGPSTRTPVLWLLPSGKRVVRAEVEAEFAYKIAEKEGRKVTIYDGSNFTLVYEGTLRRISTGYLPKRSQVDSLTVNPTKVLECTIEVTDPTPPGKPPLRIGQPVRVSFH